MLLERNGKLTMWTSKLSCLPYSLVESLPSLKLVTKSQQIRLFEGIVIISQIRPCSKKLEFTKFIESDTHSYCTPSYVLHMNIHSPSSLLCDLPEGIFASLASTNKRNYSSVGKQKYGQGCEEANHQSQFYHIIL